MFCREQAAHFESKRDAFDALGVGLAAISTGTPEMADEFVRQFKISFPVYTDPGRRAFEAANMRYALGFSLATMKHAARALAGGFTQGLTKGHAKQQGGVMVIDTTGTVRFAHQDEGPGEHLHVDQVLEKVRGLEL
jgi:peroxiredoxin